MEEAMIPLPKEIDMALEAGRLPDAPLPYAPQVLETEALLAPLRRILRGLFRREMQSAQP
jgi:hypothetical protein